MSPRQATALVLASCVLGLGCSDPRDAFHGVWEPASPLVESDVVAGEPVVALGHYGREVAGVVYYRVTGGSRFRQPCPCSFVDHLSYDSEAAKMKFETACDTQSQRHLWSLELVEDPTDGQPIIAASVNRADGQGPTDYLELRRVDTDIPARYKACPPD